MVPLCAPRLAAVAAVATAVAAAVAVAATPTVAVAAPRMPHGGRAASRGAVVDEPTAVAAVADEEGLVCLPALAPTCDLEAHMDLPSMEVCLADDTHSQETLAAYSAFASIKAMVAAAHPAATGTCCYAKQTIVDIQAALGALAPSVRCTAGAGVALPGVPVDAISPLPDIPNDGTSPLPDIPNDGTSPLPDIPNDGTSPLPNVPSGVTSLIGWSDPSLASDSVVIPGDNRLWCCDAQHYAPGDPANRPCCVDGCYEMAATFAWMGFTLDSCCSLLNNREQYGRVCPAGTINKVLVQGR